MISALEIGFALFAPLLARCPCVSAPERVVARTPDGSMR